MSLASLKHWDDFQVAVIPDDVDAQASYGMAILRAAMYPGLFKLMPVKGYADKTVIDFGCGPGHDTIGFLENEAAHVYAVDSAPNALRYTRSRLAAHGWEDRCTLVLVGEGEWRLPKADHIHTAGVIHHIEDPVAALRKLSYSLRRGAEIRMMVYDADSELVKNYGGPQGFEQYADGDAPIAKAWTKREVEEIAAEAGLKAKYLGGYLMGEASGPGCGGCWRLTQ